MINSIFFGLTQTLNLLIDSDDVQLLEQATLVTT